MCSCVDAFFCFVHGNQQVTMSPWPHVAYKLIRAKAILAILTPPPALLSPPPPSTPFLSQPLPPCIQQPGCFQPVWCQDSDFRISFYKPHLEQLVYFVYSVSAHALLAAVWGSEFVQLSTSLAATTLYSLSLRTSLPPPPHPSSCSLFVVQNLVYTDNSC